MLEFFHFLHRLLESFVRLVLALNILGIFELERISSTRVHRSSKAQALVAGSCIDFCVSHIDRVTQIAIGEEWALVSLLVGPFLLVLGSVASLLNRPV